MPQPAQSDVHVDVPLTNISIAYIQSQTSYIATKVFPIVPVDRQSNKFFTYGKNDWFRDEAERRADASPSAGSGYNLSTDSYACDVWGFHKDIGSQARANADNPLDPERDATQFVTQRMLLRQERQWVSDAFATSIWGTDKVGNTDFTYWSDYAGSDPIDDIEAGKETILSTTGFLPNTLALGYQVWRKLKQHPDFLGRVGQDQTRVVTTQLVSEILEIPNILVAKAVYASNQEGATAAYAFTHGKHAWLGYVNPDPSPLQPSAGYTFAWKGISGDAGAEVAISSFYLQELKATRVEGESAFDNKIVATDLGYFFSGAVA
jgi:hypothetical protein